MPLPLPSLDNRTFEELLAEGRRLIPRHAPAWTDHNASDPGITLMELFAWLTEAAIYRLDRLPEASYRAFLHLLGVTPRPARVAGTVLRFSLSSGTAGVTLPAGIQVEGTADPVTFQTTHPLYVSPARLAAVLTESARTLNEETEANDKTGLTYAPLGARPASGDALYLGFDRPLGDAGAQVNLYVWTSHLEADRATRAHLLDEAEAMQEAASQWCPPGRTPILPDWRRHYSARTVWEYFTTGNTWVPFGRVSDETRALSLSGPVRFSIPEDHAPGGPAPGLYFVRCRLVEGRYECPPEIDRVGMNTAEALHAADVGAEAFLGTSDGTAGQTFTLAQAPVVAGSTRLRLVADSREETDWMEVATWDQVGPLDRAYHLDAAGGMVTFGDGRVGRVPPEGIEMYASYQIGGGPGGNVAARSLTRLVAGERNTALVPGWETLAPSLRLDQPFLATGGAAAETLTDAQGRAVADLARRYRAVTLGDFAMLALETPGVPVARAHALANYHPSMPCVEAAGCVTVIVVPECPDPAPTPGTGFLDAVACYLKRRRTVTTEVHLVGPCYTQVTVHARLHVAPGSRVQAADARAALDAFFHPLTGGPDGTGWPLGRAVYRSEVMALLQELPGVLYVDGFGFETDKDGGLHCEEVTLCPDGLVASGVHQIDIIPEEDGS